MMKNNRGYALVTVLLIISIFFMLATTFFTQSASSTKQNKKIEESSQSVALAEMGIKYFENYIRNIYESNYQNVLDTVKDQRNVDLRTDNLQSDQYYIKKAMSEMKKLLPNSELDIDPPSPKNIGNEDPSINFKIEPIPGKSSFIGIGESDEELTIEYVSAGREGDETTKIKASMFIDFSDFLTSSESANGNTKKVNSVFIGGTQISDPGDLPQCSSHTIDFNGGQDCQINSDENNPAIIESLLNSTVKVNGPLSSDNINNDIKDSKLFVTGNWNVKNMNSTNNLSLHVDGTATFGSLNELNDSTIEIGGHTTFEKNAALNNTSIYIDDSATINKLTLGDNSKVCVNGDLTIENQIKDNDNDSYIYVKGIVNDSINNNDGKNNSVITDNVKFNKACMIPSSSATWNLPNITVHYDYEYDYE